ncbi:hypothetical protein BEL04_04275 [Mucilaginibacter sp. PPCGB 2223]|uniref:YdcF family protein n=1 Tax=Mucilaginibacter sp. PPCGB 2223 TaxID=1886027 RepID=UPI000824999E|nr:YdcF family protein [Mucilaginibacter sp. PPCGB 2223]OCX53523.1 hypothetical protein BEL04_04275 [Mucilaginibacter sp. PPCGB 2223]
MKKCLLLLVFAVFGLRLFAQESHPSQQYQPIGQGSVKVKNYYLLSLIKHDPAVMRLLENDAVLADMAAKRNAAISASLTDCKDYTCFTANLKFTDDQIKTVGERLAALYTPLNALGKLVKTQLIPSGTHVLNQKLEPKQLLVKAWEIEASGVNRVISVYAEGKKPNYPTIDSISFNVHAKGYTTQMANAVATLYVEVKSSKLFFQAPLTAALIFLDINERTDAANDEPMAETVNKAAVEKARTVDWNKYRYSVILVPGAGPGESGMALSAEGMLRCRLGANRYFEGLAPFVMTSGGKVHPFKTKFCEADEMKKYLVESLHVPASAVIVEPQARHTTTNMRNGVRLMYHYGFPFGKPAITCTDKSQSEYIEKTMADRCMKELGYMPYKLGKRLSDTEQEFYPLIESLQINPLEPLDP